MNSEETGVIQERKAQLCKLVKLLLVTIVCVAAALTVITHISQICGIPFYLYAIIGTCFSVIVIFLVLRNNIPKEKFAVLFSQQPVVLALLLCCLLSVALCLFSLRYDSDDADYVPNMIYYMEHPGAPMDFKIHYLDSGAEPFVSYHISTSLPFERAQGIVAYLGRMNYLTLYYLLTPSIIGFILPLVWFYLISRFSFSPGASVTGAFFICLSLILLGEQHRSFGNFAFNRIFQGKVVLLSVGLPLFSALTIDFFRSPDKRNWLYLFAASVSMVGLSNSAAVLVPLLAVVLSVSCVLCYITTTKSRVLTLFKYFFVLVYPVFYGLSILLLSFGDVSGDSVVNQPFPVSFFEHAKAVFGGPVVGCFFIMGTISAIVLLEKRERRILVPWILLVIVLYLNPLVSPLVIKYVTSPNIYWRIFYLLPFPLVVGLSAAGIHRRLGAVGSKCRGIALVVAGVLLLCGHLPSWSSSVFRHGRKTRLSLPGYKVSGLAQGREVIRLSPPAGTMLAAPLISCSVPMLTSKYPQICIRTGAAGIRAFMSQHDPQSEAEHRIKASYFLGGNMNREGENSLIWIIQRHRQIRSIAAYRRAAEARNFYLFRLLGKMGFTEAKVGEDVVVFIKPTSKK
jgi:hypothetical protein